VEKAGVLDGLPQGKESGPSGAPKEGEEGDAERKVSVEVSHGRKEKLGEVKGRITVDPEREEPPPRAPGRPSSEGEGPEATSEPSEIDGSFVRRLSKSKGGKRRQLSASDWEVLIKRYEPVRERLSPDEKRVVDEYYRLLRDVR